MAKPSEGAGSESTPPKNRGPGFQGGQFWAGAWASGPGVELKAMEVGLTSHRRRHAFTAPLTATPPLFLATLLSCGKGCRPCPSLPPRGPTAPQERRREEGGQLGGEETREQ